MLSLRITVAPDTLKSSPPSLTAFSPFAKCDTFTHVLANAGDCKSHNVTDDEQPPCLTRPDPALNSANFITGPVRAAPHDARSVFPVYGPFELLDCVSTGGFGAAWKARDRNTGRLLCLKVFESVQRREIKRSVRMELRAFKRLAKSKRGEKGRQFIMQLNRSMQFGTEVLFAMELTTTDLASYFFLEPERCRLFGRRWIAQIALGIQSLHEMAIMHRDIKSENILIDSRENIRIIDFGLTCLDSPGKFPRAFDFLGTPSYMAPEMLRNKHAPNDQRMSYGVEVDWWALGCVLFELESRDHLLLFETETDTDIYVTWIRNPDEFGQTYPAFDGLEPAAVHLLQGLLRVEPSNRYSLNDMEKHAYFLRCDGSSEFDNAAARALQSPIRPGLVPRLSEDRPKRVVEAARLATSKDWTNLQWASAEGVDETVV